MYQNKPLLKDVEPYEDEIKHDDENIYDIKKPQLKELIATEDFEESLMHYGRSAKDGAPIGSGRYRLGSGDDPYQHNATSFINRIKELEESGLTKTEIAKSVGMSTTELRVQESLAKQELRNLKVDTAKSLKDQGLNTYKIAEKMGIAESSVRSLLNTSAEARMNAAQKTAKFLKEQVDKKGMIDIGSGTELYLGVSKEKLKEAVYILEREGYLNYGGRMPQSTNPGKWTTLSVLCKPGTEHKEIYDYDKIHSLKDFVSYDNGETFRSSFVYPSSLDSKRMKVRYAEEGGLAKDGLIELRRGVQDLDLGLARYAQVRIMVDKTHYMKGMAVYSDDLPDGVDVIFNTNKKKGTKLTDVLKPIKDDPDNPFGSLIKEHGGQSYYIDKKTGKEKLSLINKRAEEGDWGSWADKLSSQFLAKQNMSMIKKQLNLTAADKQAEFDEICSLTNPTLKKSLLKSFADDCDAAAVHLKAASLPRQKYQVLIPLTTIKDTEVYAPNYKNGEKVALVRYPHGGTFEIPIVTVNNKLKEGRKLLTSTPLDAIGISSKVAERLSGADFDGDTVMVIPTGRKVKVTSTQALEGLKGFDPKTSYPERKGMKYMRNTQTEMGKISNLITDMTLKGASQDELARAVRHSMVVIDAEKHKLDYKKSEADNGISALKKKYQNNIDELTGKQNHGASTLISRAKSTEYVPKRVGTPKINMKGKSWYDPTKPEGSYIYNEVEEEYIDKNGKKQTRTIKSTKMAEASDARTLSSGTPQEEAYAAYANRMKYLANEARKTMLITKDIPANSAARKKYSKEVQSLTDKLNIALMNSPKERKAQILANSEIAAKKKANPDMTKAEVKKASQQALTKARAVVGAKRTLVDITDKEWEAIQSGAVTKTKLAQIINNADIDKVRERATPRNKTTLSNAKIAKISAMKSSGYTTAEIAKQLGISTSTVSKYLK